MSHSRYSRFADGFPDVQQRQRVGIDARERRHIHGAAAECPFRNKFGLPRILRRDRKSTRLNSSHSSIWYAVFCVKKKKLMLVAPCVNNLAAVKKPPTVELKGT